MHDDHGPAAFPADAVPGLVWRADGEGRCDYLNKAWLDFTGTGSCVAGRDADWMMAIHPEDRDRRLASHRAALAGRAPFAVEYRLRRHDGRWRWIIDQAATMTSANGSFAGHIGCGIDIHEHRIAHDQLRRALEEKSTLLAELQHRVRNTVQMIASMLTFQARRAAAPEAARLLGRSARRVRAMGLAQERLFARTGSASRVDLAAYLVELARELVVASQTGVRFEARVEKVTVLAGVAAPLGFMVGELIANALQHAFPNGHGGAIRLELHRHGRSGELVVGDDGIGLPAGTWARREAQRSADMGAARIGMTLLAGLARQAHADVRLEPVDGARFRISFPLD